MYPIIPVDRAKAEGPEPRGTKRKFWYLDERARRMLFKAEERGTGEDWAEKIASELAALLGVPHVDYELAVGIGSGTRGVVCETCAPVPDELQHGNELLLESDSDYPADGRKYKVTAHSVHAVVNVLNTLDLPPARWCTQAPTGIQTAVDVFTGYTLLDAWIANTDRHYENWAALRVDGQLHLAPTFDHGASLARNPTVTDRQHRLSTTDRRRQVAAYARRARSAFYDSHSSTRPLSTVAACAFATFAETAAETWRARLECVSPSAVQDVLDNIPAGRMTNVSRRFTVALLAENRRRLLAGEIT